jgi:hypothetical protein
VLTLWRNLQNSSRASTLRRTRAQRLYLAPKDFGRASALELLRWLSTSWTAYQTLKTSPCTYSTKYWSGSTWKLKLQLWSNFHYGVCQTFYRGVDLVPWLKRKLGWTNGRQGGQHVTGQPGMSMQLTSWSQYLLHVALGSIPAKKAQEPPQLRPG